MNIGARVKSKNSREIGEVTDNDHMAMDGNNHELDMVTVKWVDGFVSYFYQKDLREIRG